MQLWKSDLCGCESEFEINDNEVTGTLLNPCEHHTTFQQSLDDNRKKNRVLNSIMEVIELTDEKYITYEFNENHELIFNAIGFNESEQDIFEQILASY